MATALVRGMLRAGVAAPADITATDAMASACQTLCSETGIGSEADNRNLVRNASVVVLAVKPQVMAAVLSEIRSEIAPRHLVISVAAGVPLAALRAGLGDAPRLIRVMPNTPALIGAGAAAYSLDPSASPDDEHRIVTLLNAVGRAFRVPEHLLDAVTGLSGSGPAYVYQVIEALSDGGVRMGLPRDVATGLAAQTVLGAARMVLETQHHPGVLKDQVTSPGGTTIAGLHALERAGMRAALMDAVEAATRRASELSRPA